MSVCLKLYLAVGRALHQGWANWDALGALGLQALSSAKQGSGSHCLQPAPEGDQAGQVLTEPYWRPQLLSLSLGGGDPQQAEDSKAGMGSAWHR